MALSVYVFFKGNCREAFDTYKSLFGTEYEGIQTYADSPQDLGLPPEDKDRVMHATLNVPSGKLMGSDIPSKEDKDHVIGSNYSISLEISEAAELDRLHAGLSDGGSVIMEPQKTFWGSYFSMCTDRFGIRWMLSAPA